MKRNIEQLRIENEIPRVCRCSTVSSIPEKVDEVKRLQDKFTPRVLCKALNLSRATFYRVSLEQKKKTWVEENNEFLRPLIQTEFDDRGSDLALKSNSMNADSRLLRSIVSGL